MCVTIIYHPYNERNASQVRVMTKGGLKRREMLGS